MKKASLILLAILLTITVLFTPTALAAPLPDSGLWIVKTDTDGSIYLENTQTGEHMIEVYGYNQSGHIQKRNLVEYALELNKTNPIARSNIYSSQLIQNDPTKELAPLSDVISWPVIQRYYTETHKYKGIGSAQKCTPDVKGPGQVSYGQAISITESFGGGVSIGGPEKGVIRGGASFSWQISLKSDTSFGMVYNIPSGKIGYVQFKPYLNVSEGNLRIILISEGIINSDKTYYAWGACPIKLSNGFADGLYELITRPA